MKVNLPTPLVEYTGGKRDVEATGDTLAALLQDLDRRYPGMRFRIIDEQGNTRAHIKLFVNGELVRALATPIAATDTVMIVAALSGG